MHFDIFRNRIRGTVITAFDPDHAAACDALVWNGRKPERRARLIVRAACAEDVQEAVRYAAEHGLTVSPRGGGHQFTGIAARADMVVDLAALDGLSIDVAGRTARVEPAVTNARLATALGRHDLAFPVGHCGSVPVSGYLLGGGVGWNSGAWGIACFSVEAVEVITAAGSRLTATAAENADIFWAARGAGPEFFGIITAYHVRLYEAPRAIMSAIRVYPGAAADAVASWAEAAMAGAPSCVEFTIKVAPGPSGPSLAAIATVFAAGEAEARSVHATLAEGAPDGALGVIGPMPTPFEALYESTAASMPQGRRYAVDSLWSEAALGEVLGPVVEGIAKAPSDESFALLVLRPRAVPTPADAAFSRVGRVFGAIYGVVQDEGLDERNEAWLRATVDSVAPFCTGTYVGESDLDRPARQVTTHSAPAAARLAELRSQHDPLGLFRALPANVEAAAA